MPSQQPRSSFNAFLAEVLENEQARAAFEDAQSRGALVDALVRFRHRFGLTQSAVAKRMGVGQPTLSGFENEGSDPRMSTIQRYARAVDATVVWSVCERNSSRLDVYARNESRITLHISHDEPTARALSWNKKAPTYSRAAFAMAA